MSSRLATPPDAITGSRTAAGDFRHAIRVDAGLSAVARDVGHDCGGDSRRAEPIRRFGQRELAGLDPSFDGEPAVANIERAEHSSGKLGTGVADQLGIEQRRRSNRHAIGAARERRAHRLDRAQSAAHVDRAFHRRANLRDRLDVARRSGNRAVEVDNVDKLRARSSNRRASPPGSPP